MSDLDTIIIHWRSAIVGIAAEPQRHSIPALDHAMNQLTLAVRSRELEALQGEREGWAKYAQGLEAEIAELRTQTAGRAPSDD